MKIKNTPEPAPSHAPPPNHLHHDFLHGGRRYRLFRRADSPTRSWYLHFQHRGKRYKKSLTVNTRDAAVTRAKRFIDSVRGSEWTKIAAVKARSTAPAPGTIGEVVKLYEVGAMVARRTARNNALALRMVVRVGDDNPDPDKASLTCLTEDLVRRYQAACAARAENREDRERAARSSRSTVLQARCLFIRPMLTLYRSKGVTIPDLSGFMSCPLVGSTSKSEYHQPPDSVIEQTFTKVQELEQVDLPIFLAFWFAVGAGLRRGEIAALRWDHLVERDGRLWVSGGIGKNGERIEVPVQAKAVQAIAPHRQPEGKVMPGLGVEWAKRLNWWLTCQGWTTEKKLHELRAYVGSLIYRENPLAAMKFLRHSSIRITEQFYVRYHRDARTPDVL